MSAATDHFRDLHRSGIFVMPNPWDVGSAKLFERLGFAALATTSSGHAATLGKRDQEVSFDELVDLVAAITAAVDLPLNVDMEWGFADDPDDLVDNIDRLAAAGAAGFSLEDFDPTERVVVSTGRAVERVAAGAEAAVRHGLVLTARAENHLYGAGDIDDTVDRLTRYLAAGAECLYAPGPTAPAEIERVVAIGAPVNVLARPGAPSVGELERMGVRRVSTGGALSTVAYAAARKAAGELLGPGTYGYFDRM